MKRFGLIGRTLKHSFSKDYFTRRFARENLASCVYENFELASITEFPALVGQYPDLAGLNVTIPYKADVLPFLTSQSEVVKTIGACNCIRIDGHQLTGHNTDVVGFRNSLEPKLKPHHHQALVLGTGGAAKAICFVLEQLGITYQLVSRQKGTGQLAYEDLNPDIIAQHYLLVNTTPVGMYPNMDAAPPIPYTHLTPNHFLFDIIYNPETTAFLSEGKKRGAQTCNGYEMLIGQAEESWRIWTSS